MAHSHESHEEHVPGVTHDPVLRPIGILMIVVGLIWALFSGMAAEAGTFGMPVAAASLVALGVLLAGVGKKEIQI